MKPAKDDDAVPSLPRGRGLKLSGQVLVRIGMTLLLLVMLLFMQKPCADAVSHFVTGFGSDGSGSNGSAAARPVVPPPGTIDPATLLDPASDRYEHTGPNPMTIEETKAMIERARAKAAMRAGSGSAGSDPAGSGSASSDPAGSGSAGSDPAGSGSGSRVTP